MRISNILLIKFFLILYLIVLYNNIKSIAQSTPDPGIAGAFAVSKLEYNLGDGAAELDGFPYPVEVVGSVHFPTDLSAGPFPVLIFLHGRHSTCFKTSDPDYVTGDWPCDGPFEPIVSYEGYDYLAENMASHGYIVISISANSINAFDAEVWDYGMAGRAELIQYHLDLWNTFNTVGGEPFGDFFVGKLDLNNVGTMGHSRGGEGVVANALLNTSLGSPYGIHAVLALAPVDFLREVLNYIPLLNIAPYCDGDVSDLQGVHYFDDTRYSVDDDNAAKYSILMMGANHNFYNTVWTPGDYIAGTIDDWDGYFGDSDPHCGTAAPDNKRLTVEEQRASFVAYAAAFFRVYLGNEVEFLPILTGDDIIPPASSLISKEDVFVSYHASDSIRFDINKTDEEENTTSNSLGGAVETNSLSNYEICGAGYDAPDCDITFFTYKKPHEGGEYDKGLSAQKMNWNNAEDFYENELPIGYHDISNYADLQFRVAVNFDDSPEGDTLDFTVQLIDTAENIYSEKISDHTEALFYPPGESYWALPKVMFNTVKIPLDSFAPADLHHIEKIKFLFDNSPEGAILISDLALSGNGKKNTGALVHQPFFHPVEIVNETAMQIQFYPNPTDDAMQYNSESNFQYIITNAQGSQLQTGNLHSGTGELKLNELPSGVYFIQTFNDLQRSNFRFVKL